MKRNRKQKIKKEPGAIQTLPAKLGLEAKKTKRGTGLPVRVEEPLATAPSAP